MKNSVNCWKPAKASKLQHSDETSASVNALKIARYVAISSQAPNRGRFNGHYVASSEAKCGASFGMKIWSDLCGNTKPKWYYRDALFYGDRDGYQACGKVRTEVSEGEKVGMLGVDGFACGTGVWTNKVTRRAASNLCASTFLHAVRRGNPGRILCAAQVRQPEVRKSRTSFPREQRGQCAGHEGKESALVRLSKCNSQADRRIGKGNLESLCARAFDICSSQAIQGVPIHYSSNSDWSTLAARPQVTAAGSRPVVNINDYLGGFGIVHTLVANVRIVKWDSQA